MRRYTLPAYVDAAWVRWLPILPLDRTFTVPLVHADDVADACVRAVERRVLGPFNLAAASPLRRDDIARVLNAKPIHVPASVLGLLVQASWWVRLQPIDRGWLDMAFTVPLLATDRAREVLGWKPQWDATEASADVIDGMVHGEGTVSPVLRPRSFVDALTRDVAKGPLTTRHVP